MKYDVIIIGGGLSGLHAGALLAKRNKKVILFEQGHCLGGLASSFKRKGYYFDAGISRSMPVTKNFFEGLNIPVHFQPHRVTYNIQGRIFSFSSVEEAFTKIAAIFSEEKDQILQLYNEQIKEMAALVSRYIAVGYEDLYSSRLEKIKKNVRLIKYIFKIKKIKSLLSSALSLKVNDVLKKYLDENGDAYAFLKAQGSNQRYNGMNMFQYVGGWSSHFSNQYVMNNGYQDICDQMAELITSNQGKVETSTRVTKILIRRKRCVGVEIIKNGLKEIVFANKVISAIDLKKTAFQLIGKEFLKDKFSQRLEKQPAGDAIPVMYLGLNIPREKIREYFKGNEELLYFPELKKTADGPGNKDFYKHSCICIHASCLHNQNHAPEDKSNVSMYLAFPPRNWMNNWGIKDGKRTEEYTRIKEMVTVQILETVAEIIPEIKDKSVIEVCELATPYTFERYTGGTGGASVGFSWDRDENPMNYKPGHFIDHFKGIANFYCIGQYTGYMGSLPIAMMSGFRIAKKI